MSETDQAPRKGLLGSPSPTLHDVAQTAGVSHTTVSLALKNDPRITPSTREKVIEAARLLGYVPNETARGLVRYRTGTLAVVCASFSSAYEAEVLRGIEHEMRTHHPDFGLVQYSTGGHPSRADEVHRRILRGNIADAIICLDDPPEVTVVEAYRQIKKPLVVFTEGMDETSWVHCDGRLGATLGTQALLDSGCQAPWIVTSRFQNGQPHCDPERWEVFTNLCQGAGVKPRVIEIDNLDFDSGKALAARLQGQTDGVFCAGGDLVAIGLMSGFRDLGVAIPQSVKIVGYDGLAISSMVNPGLTTVAQPLEEMGRQAVQFCFSLLTNFAPTPLSRLFEPVLVRRKTT
ncbi:MAG: LacI family DNA-binding transcriptional regulator [Spirochaetales bacterium]|nr:LacI family DNA-binding transcriptional regulator [Spirochaetales bacterium]